MLLYADVFCRTILTADIYTFRKERHVSELLMQMNLLPVEWDLKL